MKKWIGIVAAFVVLTLALTLSLIRTARLEDENRAIRSSLETEIERDYSVQQEITRRELKKYFADEVAKFKEYGIKAKNVENIINVEYRIVDSTRYRDTLVWVYDTMGVERVAPFAVQADCYTMEGVIFGDTLEVICHQNTDDILVSLYREKRKCLFERQRIKAIAVSGCTGDTLRILRNIKVMKRQSAVNR